MDEKWGEIAEVIRTIDINIKLLDRRLAHLEDQLEQLKQEVYQTPQMTWGTHVPPGGRDERGR